MRTTNEQTKQTNKQTISSSAINQRFTNITLAFLTVFFFIVQIHTIGIDCQHVHVNEALAHTQSTNTHSISSIQTHTHTHPKVSILVRSETADGSPFGRNYSVLFFVFCFWSVRTKTKQYETKWNEKERFYLWSATTYDQREKRKRESRQRYDGDVTDGIVGNGEREKGRKKERKRGVLYVISSHRLCGLRRLPDEAQDRESTTFQTQ